MLDEQYKELLNTYGEQPPREAWNAIEKALHQPWYVKPWGKVAIFTTIVSVSLGIIYIATTFNTDLSSPDKKQPADTSNSMGQPNNSVPENRGVNTTQKEKASGQSAASKENNNNIPYTINPVTGNQQTQTNKIKSEQEGASNNMVTPVLPDQTRKTGITHGNMVANPPANTSSLSLKLSANALCVGKIVYIKVKGAGANMILDFGDNHRVNLNAGNIMLPYVYSSSGVYNVCVKFNDGVIASETLNLEDKPQAYFKSSIAENTAVQFNNLSASANKFFWFFDDGRQETATENKPITHYYTSSSRKVFNVKLIALNTTTGCSDTFESPVQNLNFRNYFFTTIPNVFTPNNDGLNDVFEIPASEMKEWHLIIVDASGRVVYETEKQQNYWNGKFNNTGNECAAGNYRYIIKYRQPDDDEMHQKAGLIALIRE